MTEYISTLVRLVRRIPNISMFLRSKLSNVTLYNLATPYFIA